MRMLWRADLSTDDQALLDEADSASISASAAFSRYCVGAALRVRTPDGALHTVTGNNYETRTFKSVCAEKHAVIRAYAEHTTMGADGAPIRPVVEAVAVYCRSGGTPQQPCGDCRQTLFEVNPEMIVIAAAGQVNGLHDPRVSVTSLRELLPHGFELRRDGDQPGGPTHELIEPEGVDPMIVHYPRPAELKSLADERAALLADVRYLLLVGSPGRARAIAEHARDVLGGTSGCYCDLATPGYNETVREFSAFTLTLPDLDGRVAVLSHGVGEAGAEIVLSEFPALLELVNGRAPAIRGVIRAGTRGTLGQLPLGCVGLSTAVVNEHLERVTPHPAVLDALRGAAAHLGMRVVPDAEVDTHTWTDDPLVTVAEGTGMAARFFWRGQARPLYRARPDQDAAPHERRERLAALERWAEAGVRFIEMEDFAVLELARACGYPAATIGAVIAHRRRADGTFQVDYDKNMYKRAEMIPGRLALEAFRLLGATPE